MRRVPADHCPSYGTRILMSFLAYEDRLRNLTNKRERDSLHRLMADLYQAMPDWHRELLQQRSS